MFSINIVYFECNYYLKVIKFQRFCSRRDITVYEIISGVVDHFAEVQKKLFVVVTLSPNHNLDFVQRDLISEN